jgi:hypothetical protein
MEVFDPASRREVEFEVLTAVNMKSSIYWDINSTVW